MHDFRDEPNRFITDAVSPSAPFRLRLFPPGAEALAPVRPEVPKGGTGRGLVTAMLFLYYALPHECGGVLRSGRMDYATRSLVLNRFGGPR